jgi:hypothetical protein
MVAAFRFPVIPSRLLSRSINIKLYKIISPVTLYEHKIWSLTLTSVHRMKMSQIKILQRIFVRSSVKVRGDWGNYVMKSFVTSYSSPDVIRMIKSGGG